MVILSIDASTKASGIALFEDGKLIDSTVITASSTDLLKRINKQLDGMEQFIKSSGKTIDEIYIEEVLPDDVKHNQIVFKALMYLQAGIALRFHDLGLPQLQFMVSSEWRKLCGIHTGRGVKRENLKAAAIQLVETTYGEKVTDDEADAICIGHAAISRKTLNTYDGFLS